MESGEHTELQQTESQLTGPQPTGSQQTGPQPTGFQQAGSQLTGPQPTGSQQTGPQPTGSQQTGPQPTGSQLAGPQPTRSQQTGPQPTGSQLTGPQPTGSQQTGPQPTGSQQTGSQPTGSQLAGPQMTGPQLTGPQPTGSQQTGSQLAGPQLAGPQPAEPQSTGSQPTGSQLTVPQHTGPQLTGPQPTGSQLTGLQPTGPQPTGSQLAGPQPTGLQMAGPQQTGPQVTGSQATASQQTASQQKGSQQIGSQQTGPHHTLLHQTGHQQTGSQSPTVQFDATDLLILRLHKMVWECARPVLLEVFKAVSHSFAFTQSILTYLETKKHFSKNVLKNYLNRSQRETLLKDFSGDTYDVSLLHVVITLLRADLETDPKTNKLRVVETSDTLQSHLIAVKEFRNELMHKYKGSSSDFRKDFVARTETLREELREILEAMKTVFNADDSEIQKVLQCMNDNLNHIRDSPVTYLDKKIYDDQLIIMDLNQLVISEGIPELASIYKKWTYISPLSFVDGFDVFLEVGIVFTRLEIIECGKNSHSAHIDYTGIFDLVQNTPSGYPNSETEVILIEGPAGCGKTTLTKMLLHNWVARTNTITGLVDFDLLFYIECRNPNIKTLLQLIKSLMPQTAKRFREEDLLTCVTEFRLLFLIDGFDEINASSAQVIKEIFNLPWLCSATIICTSRPERIADFYKMAPSTLKKAHIKVLGIPDDRRIEFAENYHNELIRTQKSKQKTSGLTEYLKHKSVRLQEHLRLPLNLVMITLLWALAPERVNSVTSASELYRQILDLSTEKMIERLKCKDGTQIMTTDQLKKKTEVFLLKLYHDSLKSLKKDKIVLTDELTERLQDTCDYIGLPADEVTGAFLVQKRIWTETGMTTYVSFPHKGLQDFYAALYLFNLLQGGKPKTDITDILSDIQTVLENHEVPSLTCYAVINTVSEKLQQKASASSLTLSEIIKEECEEDGFPVKLNKYQNVFVHLVGLLYSVGVDVPETTSNELVELLLKSGLTDTAQWLDILVDTHYDSNMTFCIAKNVPHLISGDLVIQEGSIAAYVSLLPYAAEPDSVTLEVAGPEYSPHLLSLLDQLMECDAEITLEFTYQFRHPQTLDKDLDDQLKLVFERCEVLEFVGRVSGAALKKLGHHVTRLSLAICDTDPDLGDAIDSLGHYPNLQHLDIHVPAGTTLDGLPALPNRLFTLHLSGVTSQHFDWVGQALQQMQLRGRKLYSLKFPRSHLNESDLCILLGRVRGAGVEVNKTETGGVCVEGDTDNSYQQSGYLVRVLPGLRNWI